MVARTYQSLGGVQGVRANPKVTYSPRGKDLDRIQTFVFECDPTDAFTGLVYIQGTNEADAVAQEPRSGFDSAGEDLLWVDLVELDIDAETGTFFVQTEVEISSVRIECRSYTGGKILQTLTMR